MPDEGPSSCGSLPWRTRSTPGATTPQEQLEIAENVGRFWQTAQQILDTMRAQPDGEGWMYETIRQHLLHPDVVPESYLRSMMMAILAAAHETTSNATANAFLTLLSHRKAWKTSAPTRRSFPTRWKNACAWQAPSLRGGARPPPMPWWAACPSQGQQAAAGAGLGQLRSAPF